MSARKRPWGVVPLAIFFLVATIILVGVGLALLLPGSMMETVWLAYPERRAVLMPHRVWLAPAFLALASAMAAASIGCFKQRKWGWWLATTIFTANGLSDAGQIVSGHVGEGVIGVLVAGAILFYLTRPDVRAAYKS